MERLKKIGQVVPKNSKDVKVSRFALGMEKLDRDAFGGNVSINIFVTEELLEHYTELFKEYEKVKIMSI